MNQFIEGIPVESGTKGEEIALKFQQLLRKQGLKGVYYRTGMLCGAWSLDVYLIPCTEQKKCTGIYLLSMDYGYFVSGENNAIIAALITYMDAHQPVQP